LEHFEQANFSRELLHNLQLAKFGKPTPIQKVVIPILLGKRRCKQLPMQMPKMPSAFNF
jgi:superfamily II DNA/RNA helicase